MKRQIRNKVFETNSSSVHTITIDSDPNYRINGWDVLTFEGQDFGWENDSYHDTMSKANYLYTGLICCGMFEKYKDFIEETLAQYNIIAEFIPMEAYCDGYIDHPDELYEFFDYVLNDAETLMRYLFGDKSAVYTGNDNGSLPEGPDTEDGLIVIEKGN